MAAGLQVMQGHDGEGGEGRDRPSRKPVCSPRPRADIDLDLRHLLQLLLCGSESRARPVFFDKKKSKKKKKKTSKKSPGVQVLWSWRPGGIGVGWGSDGT